MELCRALVFSLDEERLHEINDLARSVGCKPVFAGVVEMSIRPGVIDRLDRDATAAALDEEKARLTPLFHRLKSQLDLRNFPLERDEISCCEHGLVLVAITSLALYVMFTPRWKRRKSV